MATKKPAKKKPAPKKITPPPLPETAPKKAGVCGVDGYCCQGKSPEDCCGGTCGGNCGCGSGSLLGCHILPLLLTKRLWVATLLVAAMFAGFDMLWHGTLLMDRYLDTSYLWRTEAEMQGLTHLFTLAHALTGFVFAVLLTLLGGGLVKQIKHGILIAAPLAINNLVVYAVQPIPQDIVKMWAVGSLLQGALAGVVVWLVLHFSERYRAGSGCCGGGDCCN